MYFITIYQMNWTHFSGQSEESKRAFKEIRTPKTFLSDDTINYFITFANRAQKLLSTKKYRLLDINLCQVPEQYNIHAKFIEDDVQIMYGGKLNDVNAIGHYICVHYKHKERRVYIYNSLPGTTLYDTQKESIRVLYPDYKSIEFVKPKTTQNDGVSCGVFAIAYATTVILGKDPRLTPLKLYKKAGADQSVFLRAHIIKMLTENELSLFPSQWGIVDGMASE